MNMERNHMNMERSYMQKKRNHMKVERNHTKLERSHMSMERLAWLGTLPGRRHMVIARYRGPNSIAHLLCTGTKKNITNEYKL